MELYPWEQCFWENINDPTFELTVPPVFNNELNEFIIQENKILFKPKEINSSK